ncbi:MAG: TetR/AcrR family transcriptional regulator [Acidobacteriota bacterium]|nr:TetR/AcrR family transcriptional regulator [Acidobacteriota bacterium]
MNRRDEHAAALGRRGGLIGGPRRAAALSQRERSEIASVAARARWNKSPRPPAPRRNATQTRARIARIALEEFARNGFDGARMETIARRARVNKRLVSYYFGRKEDLFRSLMRNFLGELLTRGAASGAGLGESLEDLQHVLAGSEAWVRLSLWETLRFGAREKRRTPERQDFWKKAVADLAEAQNAGRLRRGDPGQLQLTLVALVMFPFLLPQMCAQITGRLPSDPEFLRERAEALRDLAAWLEGPGAPHRARKR